MVVVVAEVIVAVGFVPGKGVTGLYVDGENVPIGGFAVSDVSVTGSGVSGGFVPGDDRIGGYMGGLYTNDVVAPFVVFS